MSASIYTVGHGRHPFGYFLGLLKQRKFEFVSDVRAFARPTLAKTPATSRHLKTRELSTRSERAACNNFL
jgi:hypothetical protein